MQVLPIPQKWISSVTPILNAGEREAIEWTATAEENWLQFGHEDQAYELITKTLRVSGILGHQVVGMRDHRDGSYSDTWAFLCPHPWGSTVPLYTKIGIHHSRIQINLFSLHVDDGSEKLQQAIKAYLKNIKKL